MNDLIPNNSYILNADLTNMFQAFYLLGPTFCQIVSKSSHSSRAAASLNATQTKKDQDCLNKSLNI